MAEKKYSVGYEANDGTYHAFSMTSNRTLAHTRYSSAACAMPIIVEAHEAADRIMAREDSAMKRHGGLNRIFYIKNKDTGHAIHYGF